MPQELRETEEKIDDGLEWLTFLLEHGEPDAALAAFRELHPTIKKATALWTEFDAED